MMGRTDLAFVVLVISAVVLALPDNAVASPAPPETQGTVTVTPYRAKQGDPVAVVYYRCEKNAQGECTPHDGFYYVHNGVALVELPTKKDGAHVSHVPTWEKREKPDQLYICKAEMAAKAGEGKLVEDVQCHGDRDNPTDANSWRAWVVKAIYAYSVGQPTSSVGQPPIAWRTTVSGKETVHDGAFKCFIKSSSLTDCNPDIKNAGGQGTLEYWHYVNATPDASESGRMAKRWEKFTLESGKDDATAVGDKIDIKPQ